MTNVLQPTNSDLLRAREEFHSLLERNTDEVAWQKFFSGNPFVLSMSLPLRLTPQDIVPLGRPGMTEPDFFFFANGLGPLPTYGVIELKRPDSKIITVTRANAAILSRDAETAVQQATVYSQTHPGWQIKGRHDSVLALGNKAHLFVIMGMSAEITRKLSLEVYRDMIERRLPGNLKIIPYDGLLQGFEAQLPLPVHVLVPVGSQELTLSEINPEKNIPDLPLEIGETLKRAIQALPPQYRTAFVLRDVEGLSHEEIAEMLGLTIGSIQSRLKRARHKLAEALNSSLKPEWIELLKREAQKERSRPW
jgi:RNA polymerase sigma factor (sigma-70 family)